MAVNRIPKDIEVGLDKDPKKAEALLTHKYVLKVKANNVHVTHGFYSFGWVYSRMNVL